MSASRTRSRRSRATKIASQKVKIHQGQVVTIIRLPMSSLTFMNLLMDLQRDKGLTYIFITHDLSVVKHISQEIMVMYLGQCVEYAKTDDLFEQPLHPYTQGLLAAVPIPSLKARKLSTQVMRGELTSPIDPAPGCRFAARCPYATDACRGKDIPLKEVSPGHFVSCTKFS